MRVRVMLVATFLLLSFPGDLFQRGFQRGGGLVLVQADMQMLGLGGGGGGGMVKGSSFNLDTKERITRVHGAGVKLDLELLEVAAAGGSIMYTPTHVEFRKGLTRWMQTFSDGKLSLHHNDHTVLQLYTPDESPYYLLSMRGNAAFRDLILDKALSNAVAFTLCIVDSVFDESLTQASCEVRAESVHLTVSQSLEALAKSLLFVSELVASAQQNLLTELMASVQSSLVGPLQAEVTSSLQGVRGEFSSLQQQVAAQQSALQESLRASEEAANAALSRMIGEVADATTVTLAAISAEAHSNLTQLEKAVFLHFVEFNRTYGQLLDVTVGELQANVTALAVGGAEGLRRLEEEALPALYATLRNETEALREGRLSRFAAENSANISLQVEAAMNFTRALQRNVSLEAERVREAEHRAQGERDNSAEGLRVLAAHLNSTRQEAAELRAVLVAGEAVTNASLATLSVNVSNVRGEVTALASNHSVQLEQQNRSVASLAATLSGELNEVRAAATEQWAEAQKALEDGLAGAQVRADGVSSVLRADLVAVKEQLQALEQNSSSSLARSNALLAAAVGEVNQSLSLLGTAAGASFARLEANVSLREEALRVSLESTAEEVAAKARLELQQASSSLLSMVGGVEGNLTARIDEVNRSALEHVTMLGTVLRNEAQQEAARAGAALQAAQLEGATNLTNSMLALNSSLSGELDVLNETLVQRVAVLNSTTQSSVSGLSSEMATMLAGLQRLVLDLAREVYSPLEEDLAHPDYRQAPPPPVRDVDEADRYQRIDRLKRARNRQATPPPPPPPKHYLHEELRVEVEGAWGSLGLQEYEQPNSAGGEGGSGGSLLSRSAVIEKGLHKLHLELRQQGQSLFEALNTSEANWTEALRLGLQERDAALHTATAALEAQQQSANISAAEARHELGASLQDVNATLYATLQQQAETLLEALSVEQQAAADKRAGLAADLSRLREETRLNASLSWEQARLNSTAVTVASVATLAAQSEDARRNLSIAIGTLQEEGVALNASLRQVSENVSLLALRVEAVDGAWRAGFEEARHDVAEQVAHLQNGLQDATTALLEAEERQGGGLAELRRELGVAGRGHNASQLELQQALVSLVQRHETMVGEQTERWAANERHQEDVALSAAEQLQRVNSSLTAEMLASSSALVAAVRQLNASQVSSATDTSSLQLSLLQLQKDLTALRDTEASSTEAAVASFEHAATRLLALETGVQEVGAAAARNLTRVEASLAQLVRATAEQGIANSSAALAAASASLQAAVDSAQASLGVDMASTVAAVEASLQASQEASAQQLQLFQSRAEGRMELVEHRATLVETAQENAASATVAMQRDLLLLAGNASTSQGTVARLQEEQQRQATQLWQVAETSSSAAAAVALLSASATTSAEQQGATEARASQLEQRLAVLEALVSQQDKRIDSLSRENEALRLQQSQQAQQAGSGLDSVDALRRLLEEQQSSMAAQAAQLDRILLASTQAAGSKH